MKSSEKKMIAILVAITIVVIIIAIIMSTSKTKEDKKTEAEQTEKTISTFDDGTVLNNSAKLHETKKVEEMEISQIQLTEKNGETQLIATITNTSSADQGDYPVIVKMLDKEGKEVGTMNGYVGKIKPQNSIKFSTEATLDSSNVYDFTITKK